MPDTILQPLDSVRFMDKDRNPVGPKYLVSSVYYSDDGNELVRIVDYPLPVRSMNLKLVHRPPTREEHECLVTEHNEMRDALIAWAKEDRKSGEPGFSTAPIMRLIHLGQRLLKEKEANL